jgi:hypothetical protein
MEVAYLLSGAGVAHTDLKPPRFIWTVEGSRGAARVADEDVNSNCLAGASSDLSDFLDPFAHFESCGLVLISNIVLT